MSEETHPAYGPTGPRWSHQNDDGRAGIALLGGLGAAVIGGAIWAVIVLYSHYEIGWVAWGVGALVGWAMASITAHRSKGFGLSAAGLAAAGLLVGKLLITMGSASAISEEMLSTPNFLEGAVAWQMYDAEELDQETAAAVAATFEAGDTLSDALWATMTQQAGARLAGLTDTERRAVARGAAESYVQRLGVVDGILVQLGPWDLLWFGLALATAYRMLAREEPAHRPQPA